MKIFKIFHKIGTQAMPVVGRHQRDMVEIDSLISLKEYAHESLVYCHLRSERSRVFPPAVSFHTDRLCIDNVIVRTDNLYADLGFLAIEQMQTSPYGEIILHALLQSHAEISTVLQSGAFLCMPGTLQHNIMGTTGEGRVFLAHCDITECRPTHEVLRIFKRTVLYQLGIETTVSSEIDILEKDTIHRWLDGRTGMGVDRQLTDGSGG